MRRTNRSAAIVALLAVAALVLALAGMLAAVAPVNSVRLNYWLSVFSGNWSQRTSFEGSRFGEIWEYWVGVIVALSFNIGAISLLVTLVSSLRFAKRSYAMNIMQAFDVREAEIKHEILLNVPKADFEALRPVIERAFTQGAQVWREQTLVTLLGRLGARKLLEELEATEVRQQE